MRPQGLARRILPVFYVLDTSGSMQGDAIERLNSAMEETSLVLRELAAHNGDAQVKIAVLSFNSEVKWMQPRGPEDLEDFVWQPLEAGGMTYMGAAVRELNSKLNDRAFLRSATGSLAPVIVFMSDGYPNDDYMAALDEAQENPMFRNATRIGFAIGRSCDVQMLEKITGDPDAVVRTSDLQELAELIRFVSETATSMASVTRASSRDRLGAEAVRQSRRMTGYGMNFAPTPSIPEDVVSGDQPIWDMSDPI